MIENIEIKDAIKILNLCEETSSFEEKYIPSRDVKAKIKLDNWVFSDRDKATIIWNSPKLLSVKYADLLIIMEETNDETLRDQISERIRYDALAFSLFDIAHPGYIYAANTDEYPGQDCIIGYFKSKDLAYAAGKKEGYSFNIEKYQIIDEVDVTGNPVAALEYDDKGNLLDYWSCETDVEDKRRVESIGRHRFENAYVVFPNPFEFGDFVRFVGSSVVGRVDVSQENWKKYVEKALEEDAIDDYTDASITIRYSHDKWAHDHISPIYLEKVSIDLEYKPPIVMSGHDCENAYWIRPVSIVDEGCIYLDEVKELDPEISLPAEHVSGIVLEIFKRYLDMNLTYNMRRVRFDYDPNGKCVSGFGMDMVHNFYDVENVKKIAYNLITVSVYLCDRHYLPDHADISEEIENEINKYDKSISDMDEPDQLERKWDYAEFMRDLADRLMNMIDFGRDMDAIISIMAP